MGRDIEILFPVSILSFSSLLASDSTPAYQILRKLDYQRQSYDIMQTFQDGGHTVSNLLPVSGLWRLWVKNVKSSHTKLRPDMSIHGWDIRMIVDSVMMSYWFPKMMAIASQIYFRFLVWPHLAFKKIRGYYHAKFRPDISIHSWDITVSDFWKQTAAILKFHFRFRFWPLRSHPLSLIHISEPTRPY